MSGPSFKNIDLWLFELAEGNLTPAQEEQLEIFLLQYPEIDVERDVWDMAKVQSETVLYPDQEQLIKKRPFGWFYLASAASLALLISVSLQDYSFPVLLNDAQLASSNLKKDIKISELEYQVAKLEAQISDERVGNTSVTELSSSLAEASEQFAQQNNSGSFSIERNSSDVKMNSIHSTMIDLNNDTEVVMKEYLDEPLHSLLVVENEDKGKVDREVSAIKDVENVKATHQIEDVVSKTYERKNKFPTFSSSNYSTSLKSKLKKGTRAFQRMINNPIALTNYRDPSFHLPGTLNNDVNFSSAGTMLATRVQALSRLQWYGEENEHLINQLAVDGYVYGMRGGLGLQINHSMYRDGGVNIASVALTYSPKISVNKSISVEPSVRFKMGAKKLNSSKMEGVSKVELERNNVYDYYTDGGSPIGNELWYKDLGLGLMVNTKWFYVGGQIDNLFNHYDNMYSSDITNQHKASNHLIGVIGTDWVSKDESLGVSPYALYQKNEHVSELWGGVNFKYNWLVLGVGVSSNLDPAASLELKFDRVSLKYNADFALSGMTEKRSLSHQVTLKFVGKTSRFGRKFLNK